MFGKITVLHKKCRGGRNAMKSARIRRQNGMTPCLTAAPPLLYGIRFRFVGKIPPVGQMPCPTINTILPSKRCFASLSMTTLSPWAKRRVPFLIATWYKAYAGCHGLPVPEYTDKLRYASFSQWHHCPGHPPDQPPNLPLIKQTLISAALLKDKGLSFNKYFKFDLKLNSILTLRPIKITCQRI